MGYDEYKEFNECDETEDIIDSLYYISEGLKPKNGDVSILNPDGMKKFAAVYNAVKSSLQTPYAKITYGINEPYPGSGFIRIEGSKIVFNKTNILMSGARLASNFEVYPLSNGNVRMAFTFSGLILK